MRRFSHAVTPNTDEMYDDSYVDEMNVQHDAPVPYTMNDINNIDNIPDVSDMNDMSDMNNQDDYDYSQLKTDDVNIETVEYGTGASCCTFISSAYESSYISSVLGVIAWLNLRIFLLYIFSSS